MGRVEVAHRPPAFRRNILTFQFQRWYLSLGTQLREQLAPLLPKNDSAGVHWLAKPFEGAWPFPLSRIGCKVSKTLPGSEPAQ